MRSLDRKVERLLSGLIVGTVIFDVADVTLDFPTDDGVIISVKLSVIFDESMIAIYYLLLMHV